MTITIQFGSLKPIQIPDPLPVGYDLPGFIRHIAHGMATTPMTVTIDPVTVTRDGEATTIGECDCSEPLQIAAILRRYADRLEAAEVAS